MHSGDILMSEVKGISKGLFVAGIVVAILVSSAVSSAVSMQWAKGPKGDKGDLGETGPQGPQAQLPSGFISVPAAAFQPEAHGTIGFNSNISSMWGGYGICWASLQLPHNATVKNLTAYVYDNTDEHQVVLELWGFNLTSNSSFGPMAHVETSISGASTQRQIIYDDTIGNSRIDNRNCIYALKLVLPAIGEVTSLCQV